MDEFDLLVIGGGSGQQVASAAASRGMDVAIVEEGPLGGTCLNRGCIPSKLLIHRADVAETIDRSEAFGIEASIESVDFEGMVREINDHVDESAESIREGIERSDQTLYPDTAEFVDERTVEVDGERVRGENVIVAAGSRPVIPPIDGIDDVDYLTSTDALRLEDRPDRLAIVGGGYIAAELGHFFGAFGTEISIIGRRERLLSEEDDDVSETFTESFAHRYDVYTGYEADAVEAVGDELKLSASAVEDRESRGPTEDDELTVSADELLIAVGRTPNSDQLAVDEAGIETTDEGFVETNEFLETTAENVWALGDIVRGYPFKHAANYEAQHVARNVLTDHRHPIEYDAVGHAIFSSPQIAAVGSTERELREKDREYAVSRYEYGDVAMGKALKVDDGFVKALVDADDGTILGCHVIGPDAPTLLHEVIVAMRGGGTAGDVAGAVHIHPALNEVVDRTFSGGFERPE